MERKARPRTLRRVLVTSQVGFAFVLLVGAGLLFASFRQVMTIDPGFNADGVLTASLSLPASRYGDDDKRRAFTDDALRRLRALPGVTAVGATDTIPFGSNNNDSVIIAEGYQMRSRRVGDLAESGGSERPAISRRWA